MKPVHLLPAAALLAGIVLSAAFDPPPPRLWLRYGLPPAGGPTGRELNVEGVTFVELAPGYFRMGSHYGCDPEGIFDRLLPRRGPWDAEPKHGLECPVHWVSFRRACWIARTEVTNEQYERFEPARRRREESPGDRTPVVDVSDDEAVRYCSWLSARGPLAVRLPTEAEWENACRAGSSTEYCFGDDPAALDEYAWTYMNSPGRLREVATRRPNAWGFSDFHGNANELCEGTYGDYVGASENGSERMAEPGELRRGGSVLDPPEECRSASRDKSFVRRATGFRLAADSK